MRRTCLRRASADLAHLDLGSTSEAEIERIIEGRVTLRAQIQAARWRFQLVVAKSIILALAVFSAGAILEQPPMLVLRGAAFIAFGSLLTGTGAIVAALAIGRLRSRLRQRRRT